MLRAAKRLKMPAFTLYGSRGSSNSDRVRLTLAEGGFTDYEYEILNLAKGEQKAPAHINRHPWGKVPAITFNDGFTLYESRPISKYLASKYSFPLFPSPSDLAATALFDQAQSVEILYFADPAGKISFEKVAKKMMGLPGNEVVVEAAVKSLESFFSVADGILGKQEYMAGDNFTLVDIYYIPLIERLSGCGHGELITSKKNVNAWWERITGRPAIKEVLEGDREKMRAAQAAMKRSK